MPDRDAGSNDSPAHLAAEIAHVGTMTGVTEHPSHYFRRTFMDCFVH